MSYAELQVTTNFTFLRGASHPAELVERAAGLGHAAIAITDRNTLAGVVRAHAAAKKLDFPLIVGARLDFADAPGVLVFPTDRATYGRLSRLLTLGKRRTVKGECLIRLQDLIDHGDGQEVVALPPPDGRPDAAFGEHLRVLKRRFGRSLSLAVHHLYRGDDAARLRRLGDLGDALSIPLAATNDVHAHAPGRRSLQDALTCIREGCTIDRAGYRLHANAERHLKPPDEMARLFRDRPDALSRTLEIAERCAFSLDSLKYEYPVEPVPEGRTPQEELVRLVGEAVARKYPGGVPEKVGKALAEELPLVEQLNYAPYFLTVHDIVRYARSQGILCQGRGSAANSVICYCLGITKVDPDRVDLLFARFISAERNEPPDIDVDFEHERREEVIQYIYDKYGRDRAGLAATVISYRPKSAIRDVGKAMGLSMDAVGILSRTIWGWGREGIDETHIREAGLDPSDSRLRLTIELARTLIGFPRHLSQHVGGFVITKGPLSEVVPIENAAMEDRTVIEWDKDDLDALGMLKIDVLALGMLTCLRRGLDLLRDHYGREEGLDTLPAEDKAVYQMLGKADSVGVFQVESRAQMTMLPRLKPKNFYDLVVEVAIVRPGPIQGDMVHPYLRRRKGEEKIDYPKDELREVLEKTFGVPLFQEQAMRIAIVAAEFTPSEADGLRRAMATFRRVGTIHHFEEKMVGRMVERGYDRDFAQRCFNQIKGFGEYGFPESHAASFALLVYTSAWLKCHYPEVFAAAILNSQPMGFYSPSQLIRDARDHGVAVRPVDVNHSHWDCTLEPDTGGRCALRLGFRLAGGCREDDMARLIKARGGGYRDVRDIWRRTGLRPAVLETLVRADAFGSIGLGRREALWQVRALGDAPLPLFAHAEGLRGDLIREPAALLPAMPLGEQVVADYASLGLSIRAHPLALLREVMTERRVRPNRDLKTIKDGAPVRIAGLVLVRQQPGTASGVIFATLEDETGVANIVVWPRVFERHRKVLLGSRLLCVDGRVQSAEGVIHVIADRLRDFSPDLRRLSEMDAQADPYDVMPAGRNFR